MLRKGNDIGSIDGTSADVMEETVSTPLRTLVEAMRECRWVPLTLDLRGMQTLFEV